MSKYLFNGIPLPALPEYDATTRPYSYIARGKDGKYYFIPRTSKKNVTPEGAAWLLSGLNIIYVSDGNAWISSDTYDSVHYIVWANYDVMYVEDTSTLYLAASDPIPITAPVIDPLSLFLGWKAGNWVARQRGKKVEEEKTPVAYLYNGVRLPDINAVWTDKEKYPYATISSLHEYSGAYVLFITDGTIYQGTDSSGMDYTSLGFAVNYTMYIFAKEETGNAWLYQDSGTTNDSHSMSVNGETIWCNSAVLNTDGSVYLAASEPIPVNPVTPSKPFCLRSWLTGFALGLAGKAIPFVKEYPQPDDPFPIEWNNMAIKNNTSIELEGTSVFKISDSIPTSDELTNCIIVGSNSEMGSLTFAFNSVENIGSIDVFLYTYEYAAEAIPVWILRVSENTDGYEPGLYFLDVFDDISVDYAMHYITFCLYNGVKMPDIETVWVDKQKYPYAFMEAEVSDNGTIARLYLTANPVQINASELSGLRIPAGGWVQYVCTTDPNIVVPVVGYNHWKDNMMTGENDMSFDAPEESGIAWANYDVFNTDGTLYLAASEPVPVYE